MIVKIAYDINCEACSMSWWTYSTFIGNLLKHISAKHLRHFLLYRPKLQLEIKSKTKKKQQPKQHDFKEEKRGKEKKRKKKKRKTRCTQQTLCCREIMTSKTPWEQQINNVGQHKYAVFYIPNEKVTVTKVLQKNRRSAVPYSTRHLLA